MKSKVIGRWALAVTIAIGLSPIVAGPVAGLSTTGCTAAQLRADAPGIEAAFAAACPEEALIPVIGGLLAGACTGEEALVAKAIAWAEGSPVDAGAGDAGATSARTLALASTAAPKVGAPLYAGTGAARRMIGRCPCGWAATKVATAQTWLDAQPDGGK